MSLESVLSGLRVNRNFMSQVSAWQHFSPRPAQAVPLNDAIGAPLRQALKQRGITDLYSHQQLAVDAALRGENVIVSTATASGKSLCYTIPVLKSLSEYPASRALYLFPTKALAQDQLKEAANIISLGRLPVEIQAYDGDTPQSRRRKIRQSAGILITNPDMLHAGILPQHTLWRNLFSNLRFVVIAN